MLLKAVSKALALTVVLGGSVALTAPTNVQVMASNPQAVATTTTIGGTLVYNAGTEHILTADVAPSASAQPISSGTVQLLAYRSVNGTYSSTPTYTLSDAVTDGDRRAEFQTQTFVGDATYKIIARYTPQTGEGSSDEKALTVVKYGSAIDAATAGSTVTATVTAPLRPTSPPATYNPSGTVVFTTGNGSCGQLASSGPIDLTASTGKATYTLGSGRKLCRVDYSGDGYYGSAFKTF